MTMSMLAGAFRELGHVHSLHPQAAKRLFFSEVLGEMVEDLQQAVLHMHGGPHSAVTIDLPMEFLQFLQDYVSALHNAV